MRRATSAGRAGRLARLIRRRAWQGLALLVVALVLSSCGWRGITNVSIPGGPGSGEGAYTIYVQVPDTLAINGNSKVQVADVFVGSIRAINLKNWVATLKPVSYTHLGRHLRQRRARLVRFPEQCGDYIAHP